MSPAPAPAPSAANSLSARSIAVLLWRLTGGEVHATDATNASRTLLYDIQRGEWDEELLRMFRVPRGHAARRSGLLRRFRRWPRPSCSAAGRDRGIAGDQQAATIGQACFNPGMIKSTYGTGCFALLNTGASAVASQEQAPDHGRLPIGRQAHLCAGRLDLRRRRRGAMAARRPRDHQQAAEPARSPKRPIRRRTSISCRPSSAWARPTGMPRRAARCSA